MDNQQGDVLLYQTVDDGDIIVEGGVTRMTGGFETAAYLSLFGGNEDDNGIDSKFTWWSNLNETESDLKYVSETQYLLKSLPATANNLRRVNDAISRDLQWFLDRKIASSIDVESSIPSVNKIKISVSIKAEGDVFDFEFVENWKAQT